MFNTAKSSLKWETNHKFTSKQNINSQQSSKKKVQLISAVEMDKKCCQTKSKRILVFSITASPQSLIRFNLKHFIFLWLNNVDHHDGGLTYFFSALSSWGLFFLAIDTVSSLSLRADISGIYSIEWQGLAHVQLSVASSFPVKHTKCWNTWNIFREPYTPVYIPWHGNWNR